ncbi:DNA mismatch repair endonuclease MutL [Candidatus Poribacteria bacterium]|nr:DNA mismatch repair endonuclease MutL [Candidatus Poribacteria bacterium]
MPSKIKILSDHVVNRIAAGEIVERPASIVKELIENSIDAGSTQIKIFIEHGGMRSICILDNGCGMCKDDTILAFEKHTTSKIESENDLFNIHTHGFRGEALASIASVSKVIMETREESELSGSKIEIEGGILKNAADIGCHIGTKITISNLFFHTPARRKFLKTVNTELSHIINTVTQYILVYPEISFVLAHNNHILYNFPKTKNIEERIYEIYGNDLRDNLIKLDYHVDNIELTISGFISKPSYSKPNKNYQLIFVNNRTVKNKVINHAIYEGYQTFLMVDRHPMTIIYLNIAPHLVDVNIHPTKREVKFADDKIIHSAISQSVANIIKKHINKNDKEETTKINVFETTKNKPDEYNSSTYMPYTPQNISQNKNQEYLISPDENKICESASAYALSLRPLAQIKRTYWLVEDDTETYLLDQHAFHERILYEKIILSLKDHYFEIQRLLFPIKIELNIEETAFIKEHLNELTSFGLDIEYFGGTTFVIKEIPTFLFNVDLKDFLLNIYNEFGLDKIKFDFINKTAIIMACHSAIKAGDVISIEEMRGLLRESVKLNIPHFCPHGRPAMVKICTDELEKKFKR